VNNSLDIANEHQQQIIRHQRHSSKTTKKLELSFASVGKSNEAGNKNTNKHFFLNCNNLGMITLPKI
jgi:hypothetical protein